MAPIDDALAAIEPLDPGEKFCYQIIADQFDVDRTTLSRRHRRVSSSSNNKYLKQQKLTNEEEAELLRYIRELSERHLAPTRNMVRNFACQIAKDDVSERWVTSFIKRRDISLIS